MSIKHLIFAAAAGAKTPTGYWMNTVPALGNPTGVCADDSGNSYFAMWDDWTQASVIFKFDVNGQVLWQKSLPGVGINGLAKNGSTGIIACGVHYSGVAHYALMSISAAGALNWSYNYGTAGQESGFLLNVAVAASGNIYACGYFHGTGVDYARDGSLMKFSSTGALTWQKHYTGTTKVDRGFSIALDSSENVWVIGEGGNATSGQMLLKFDTNGNNTLSRVMTGDGPFGLDTDSSGNVYFQSERHSVCKMSSAGVKSWEKYQGQWNEWISTISVDSAGDIYVLHDAVAEGDGFWLYKYNSSGTLIWFRSLGSTGYEHIPFAGRQMVVTADSIFISLWHYSSSNAVFLKLRKDGTVLGNTPPLNYRSHSNPFTGDGATAMTAASFSIVARAGIAAISYAQALDASSRTVVNTIL